MRNIYIVTATQVVTSESHPLSESIQMPDGCIIYVPYSEDHSILEAYKTASIWNTYADNIQEDLP